MDADAHNLYRYAHILLFAYWLGADLGVFLGGGAMSRPGLTVAERNRIRDLVMTIDLAPRLALVLMLPVGFTLAVPWGEPLPATALAPLWAAALVWTAALVYLHFRHDGPGAVLLRRLDLATRAAVFAAMLYLGLRGLRAADGGSAWLAAKFLVFAAIIAVGMALRAVSAQWRPAIERLLAGDTATGERMLRVRRRKAIVAALSMWLLVAAAAFLGTVKP
ncbi:MAG: hypothetical protein JNM50_06465 [Chromatiales bacterium]|nr:hypothetical protein [Chromatiales bacterium]